MTYAPSPAQAVAIMAGAVLLVVGVDCACCRKPPVETGKPPVIVENRCELPPKPMLPTPQAKLVDGGSICFNVEEANALRERDAKLKQWIREVLARCGDAVSTEARDAGSSSTKD